MDPMTNTYGDSDDEMARLWASGMPLSRILEIEQQIMRRRSPANDAGADWSVIRDHTSGPLDHWLDGGDPDPRDSLPIGADPLAGCPTLVKTASSSRRSH